jgi:hypothetical protein
MPEHFSSVAYIERNFPAPRSNDCPECPPCSRARFESLILKALSRDDGLRRELLRGRWHGRVSLTLSNRG